MNTEPDWVMGYGSVSSLRLHWPCTGCWPALSWEAALSGLTHLVCLHLVVSHAVLWTCEARQACSPSSLLHPRGFCNQPPEPDRDPDLTGRAWPTQGQLHLIQAPCARCHQA